MTERPLPPVVGPLTSAAAALAGLIWGYDYITTDPGTAFDHAIIGGSRIWGIILTATGITTLAALTTTHATPYKRAGTITLVTSHAAAFTVWAAAAASLTALSIDHHTGERVVYSALTFAALNAVRVTTLPAELIPPVTWDTIRRARHRRNDGSTQ